MDFFSGLNPQQKAAVMEINGRLLVLAGAGSGKTRVLTLRMAHLIRNHAIPPRSILGLTFTNKAAAEMRHRIGSLVEAGAAKHICLCTFHSFCMQILRSEIQHLGFTGQFTLYDEKDVQRLVNAIARDLLEHEGTMPSLAPTTEAITFARNRGLSVSEITGTGSEWHDQFTQNLYQRLHNSMRAYNAVDFDSLLSLAVELFEKCPEVLIKYQERFRYIMIDEYQDTNPIQYRLAELLSQKYNNLCVVGDDDQSIYGWRGAEVQNILNFKDASVVKLEQNYRSTNIILKAANAIIANNKNRHEKVLWSDKGSGSQIEVFAAPNEIDEASAVVCRIDRLREREGLEWKDFAILYRSNALARNFETAMIKHVWKDVGGAWVRGVPYQVFGGVEFYERREVKDLFAYLRVIVNPLDQVAMLRIINYPRRGIGEAALDLLTTYNRSQKVPLWDVLNGVVENDSGSGNLRGQIHPKALRGIEDFLEVINIAKGRFARPPLRDTMEWLIERISYRRAIEEEVKSQQMRDFKWENVQEFISTVDVYDRQAESNEQTAGSIEDYVLNTPLERDWGGASSKQGQENKVTLMTFHSAKGLEFPCCFLVGMEDHIIPHEKSLKQTGIEEERRLIYVAITRAKRFLTISMAKQRKRMGVDAQSKPSRFLFEIPPEYLKSTNWHQID